MMRHCLAATFSLLLIQGVLGQPMGDAATTLTLERVASGLVFPEGPAWHPENYLLFSDVHGSRIYSLQNGTQESWLTFEAPRKTNGLAVAPDGRTLYACGHGELALLGIDLDTRAVDTLTTGCDGRSFHNVNDLAVTSAGVVYFTDPKWGPKGGDRQGVYRYDPSSRQTTLAASMTEQPNGIALSPDGRFVYVARSGGNDLWRYTISADGALSGGAWTKLPPGTQPDGMAVDADGNLYVCGAGDGHVHILDAEAKHLTAFKVFDRMATNCTFDPRNIRSAEKVLYITGGGRGKGTEGEVYRARIRLKETLQN